MAIAGPARARALRAGPARAARRSAPRRRRAAPRGRRRSTALLLIVAGVRLHRPRSAAGAGRARALPRFPRSFLAALTGHRGLRDLAAGFGDRRPASPRSWRSSSRCRWACASMVFFFWRRHSEEAQRPAQHRPFRGARSSSCCWASAPARIALDTPVAAAGDEREAAGPASACALLGVAALVLLDATWSGSRSRPSIDHRLRASARADPHERPGPGARLLTLLPLLRVTAAVLLLRHAGPVVALGARHRDHAAARGRGRGRPRARFRRAGAGARRHRRHLLPGGGRVPHRRIHRERHQPSRARSSASRCAPWRCATTTGRCISCPTARSAPCATPRATG